MGSAHYLWITFVAVSAKTGPTLAWTTEANTSLQNYVPRNCVSESRQLWTPLYSGVHNRWTFLKRYFLVWGFGESLWVRGYMLWNVHAYMAQGHWASSDAVETLLAQYSAYCNQFTGWNLIGLTWRRMQFSWNLLEPPGTSWNLCGTYTLRGPNTTSASRNLLEPARNLFGFTHLASAKRNFLKNAFSRNLLEPCRNLDILREASYGITTFHVRPSSNIYY